MKKYLNFKNLIVLLILALIASNIFLQIKVDKAINAVENAESHARNAYYAAESAASYASDASDYAEEASDKAEDAYYSAKEAASNSFGNQCWSCP